MRWNKYTLTTTTEAEDIISSMMMEVGIEGIEIEDKIPLSTEDQADMFIDFLPELPPDDGVSYVSFYIEDDGTANVLESENIDIDEVTFTNIFSNIPLKHLCSDNCKGICQKCGTNLNESQCECEDDEWNPQFEILKHLFD